MPAGRAVVLLRRFSTGDNRFKSLNLNQNTSKENILSHPLCNHRDIEISKRISLINHNTFPSLQVKRSYNSDNIIKMTSPTPETSSASQHKHTNRLVSEKSPYLLQHAHNPVDWYPWGQEAIDRARKENKLIFLSVGYSTCHWCHVMEKESFESESVAQVMNEHYINIKVDREERPDIDRVYMLFIMASTGSGGWPMSVFLTPDLRPVTGGTYFPPEDRYGRPGFKSILLSLAAKWKENQSQFLEASNNIMVALKDMSKVDQESSFEIPGEATWNKCVRRLMNQYEPEFGGFGTAPKFPQASIFNFLFHYYARDKNNADGKKCLEMCLHSLTKIAKGGIHDHVSSGFARYSVDGKWHVPHFEKMLYDQAQLTVAYTDAYLATKDDFYADVVRDIIKYVNRDLRHPSGGYYSAEDADSYPFYGAPAKQEGAFCVWEYHEIESLLGDKLIGSTPYIDIFCDYFNVEQCGNISRGSDPHGELKNKNVLIIYGSKEETADKFAITVEELDDVLAKCINILFEERLKRPRPHLDDKMLCSWNGLMLAGLAQAGQGLGEKEFIEDAVKTAKFIREHMYDPNTKTLIHSCYRCEDGSVTQSAEPIPGFLDDYAFLIKGLLDLYEATFDPFWLNWAQELQEKQNELFWDAETGGYFTCSNEDSSVVLRLKEDQDGAEPSGNSVACHNLQRLAVHGANTRDAAQRILRAFATRLEQAPTALPEMMSALMFYNDSPTQVVISGPREDERTLELARAVRSRLLAARVLSVHDNDAPVGGNTKPRGDVPTAYVCRRFACSLPVTTVTQLEKLLDEPLPQQ
ncbi:spermatogenesis-associated protein 20 [Aricia agestis]|uniref:spermatogenesis-associated protein 20 n=1 Tax=Aricia agestis TaxID=91739 RepID=UPI001C2043B4|nr:spermatogenesis-associated protein 20 [Aricia agestis]